MSVANDVITATTFNGSNLDEFASGIEKYSACVRLVLLQELGERPICSSPGCNAYATKSMGDLSERVKTATFLR